MEDSTKFLIVIVITLIILMALIPPIGFVPNPSVENWIGLETPDERGH